MRLILISNRVAIPTEDGLHRAGDSRLSWRDPEAL